MSSVQKDLSGCTLRISERYRWKPSNRDVDDRSDQNLTAELARITFCWPSGPSSVFRAAHHQAHALRPEAVEVSGFPKLELGALCRSTRRDGGPTSKLPIKASRASDAG